MKAQKVVSVILALTLMMSMVPAAFAVELENPNDIFSEEYFAYVAKEDGNPYDVDEDISVAYQSDPVQFMNQLGKIDPMYKDFYIRTLVSVAYNEFDWEGFKSQILSLSVEDSSVINQLYAYAIQFEEEEHAWEEYYKDWKNRPQAEGRFNPDIVLEAITSHAEAYTFDMEYCDYLRAMHQLDPNLFIRTISDLSKEEIQLIATQIRYAQKNKRSINTSNIAGNSTVDGIRLSDENLNEEETALKESFLTSINTPSQADEVIADEENMVVERASTSTNSLNPNCIGGIYYNNVVSRPSDLEINRAIKWQTSLSGLSPNTNYVVELWVRHVGSTTNNKKGSVSVRTNSNGKASVSQQVTFSSPGEIEATIKVYKGSTLVAERTGGSPDMVYARWSINLALNSNHLGTLYFYYASGAQAHHCDAKGKSGKGYTWDKEYGHTPPGDYYGETGGPSKDTEKYGPNKFIRMKGNQDPGYENLYVDGDYVTRGRSGLLIHGGRDQTSLWNTEGCVRIFDKDAKKITGLMDSWRSAGYHQFGRIKITRPGQSL